MTVPPTLARDGDHDGETFAGLDLGGQTGSNARFVECVIADCSLDGTVLRRARLVDCRLERVRASELDLAESVWLDSTVSGSRLGAVRAFGAEWTRVLVEGGKVDYLNLRDAHLVDVTLSGCVLGELDLGRATVRRLVLDDCRVGRLDVTGATLTDVDLRGGDLSALSGIASLAGATISSAQLVEFAPALAEHIGLVVSDAPRRT